MKPDARAAAAKVIAGVLGGSSLNRLLPEALSQVPQRDISLLQELCYGTLRQAPRLQACLDQLLEKPLRVRDRDIQALMLCGLYQLDAMRVPDHAAVDSTVKATLVLKKKWARGITNAVLRRYLREREAILQSLDDAAAHAHPDWLYRTIGHQWPAQARDIYAANNTQAPMTLRVNRRRLDRDAYIAVLDRAGITASPGLIAAQAVCLAQPQDVDELPGFGQGQVSVQDEAAQVAAHVLNAGPGERILDACAAPGGKTCHILELQPELGEMIAMDVDGSRLEKVADNLRRLDLPASLLRGDATSPPTSLQASSFDRILADAPCSATGVIRRHPDVKILRLATDIPELAQQQTKILSGLWPLLKKGGLLVYATCSVLEEENDRVVGNFLDHHPDASAENFTLATAHKTRFGRQLLPSATGNDGLFYACLRRTA